MDKARVFREVKIPIWQRPFAWLLDLPQSKEVEYSQEELTAKGIRIEGNTVFIDGRKKIYIDTIDARNIVMEYLDLNPSSITLRQDFWKDQI